MDRTHMQAARWLVAPMVMFLLVFGVNGQMASAQAVIDGVPVADGVPVDLTAKVGHIQTPDGGSPLLWGYAHGTGAAAQVQYPGPTLIVDQGATVIINLTNQLDVPVSMVFPGQSDVAATGGPGTQNGLLTREALPTGTVTYSFQASHAGTYLYHSGTQLELQVEMGLVGALIVRPPTANHAYNHPDSQYDHEYLFLLSEMDPVIHDVVEFEGLAALDSADYFSSSFPVYWFINGRAAPDTMQPAGSLRTQPYNCVPRMHPGEKLLMRVIGAGKDLHPYHHHGNHARVIARNGRLLESSPGAGADLSTAVFTIHSIPGETVDAIFEWTGKDLGWDIYGTGSHSCSDAIGCPDSAPADGYHDSTGAPCYDAATHEYCPDHLKPLPVTLPHIQELTLGLHYSGSPFMGVMDFLPPGQTELNPNAGFAFMWHSHTEKEMTNFDIFPGGMMTMMIVEPPTVAIP